MVERAYRLEVANRTTRGQRTEPVLPVAFSYARTTGRFYGLVDSGADGSVCSVQVARLAGIDLDQFPVQRIRGVGGITRARRCPSDPLVLGRRIDTEILVVEANVVLLGRRDGLAAFQFGFDERAGRLLIEPYEDGAP